MAVEPMNPSGLPQPTTYAQLAVARGSRVVFLSGQVAVDERGAIVGKGDLEAQAEQAYLNVGTALRAAGATFKDVAKMTVYVVGWTPDKMAPLVAGAMRAAERIGFEPNRPITLIGVAALAEPDFLLEVEAVAVLD
jgi:enamine deaminase RidA (YjgF/YER057c/UK114 family)